MNDRSSILYLSEMLSSMEKIERYLAGCTYADFVQQDQLVDAVERNIEKIGEAAAAIPDTIRKSHPEIPWTSMVGLRNKVIHHYFGVNYEVIFQIATKNIPETKGMIIEVLRKYSEEPE
ncbi:MAG: DUF86 domain-containing protein [Methanoregula sp.]|jgi:hypothetical protein